MTQSIRQLLIAAFTFIGGLYYFLLFVLPEKIGDFEFGFYNDQIGTGISVIGVMTIGLGLLNIVRIHGTRVVKTQRGWIFSASLLAGFLIMLASEGLDFINAERSLNAVKQYSTLALFSEKIGADAAGVKDMSEAARQEIGSKLAQLANALDLESALEASGEGFLHVVPVTAERIKEGAEAESPEQRNETEVAAEKYRQLVGEAKNQLNVLIAAYKEVADPSRPSQHDQLTQKLRELTGQVRIYADFVAQASTIKSFARLLFNGFYLPLNSAMFALLGFYISGAAYRSFRLKSVEAGVLMTTAIVVILGQIPFGKMYIHDSLPNVRVWLMENLNTPGNRAMFLGSSVAAIALAMRMWLSLEKSPLDEESSK